MFFLDAGQCSQAEAAVREAVQIHERVLAGGQLKGSVERYAARNFTNLGRVLVAAGQTARGRAILPESRESAGPISRGFARVGVPPALTWRGRCPIWRICSSTLAAGKKLSISAVA